MKNFIKFLIVVALLTTQKATFANEKYIPITVITNSALSANPLSKQNIISLVKETLVRNHINLGSRSPFLMAKVQLVNKANKKYLLVYLLDKRRFLFESVKIVLDEVNHPISVITHYKLTPEDFNHPLSLQANDAVCPDPSVTFIAASPMYRYLDNIREAIDHEYEIAKEQGYVPYKLIDDQATITSYLNWLSCPNLKAFAHIGHGSNSAIILTDGVLDADTIRKNVQLNKRTILSFNSCEVFNDPMKAAVIDDVQAQRFSGGINGLLIFGSTETYGCTFNQMLGYGMSMTEALETCKIKYDPTVEGSQSPVYILNGTQNNNNSPLPVYVLTEKSMKPIRLDSLAVHAQLDLSKDDALKEIYIMTPAGRVDCDQFSKEKGLRAKEYYVVLEDNPTNSKLQICIIYDNSASWRDQYGLGGKGSDYLLR